jgi:hypothetical protein
MEFHLFSQPETWTADPAAITPVLASFAAGPLAPTSAMVENLELPFEPAQIAAEIYKRRHLDTVSATLRSRAAVYFLTFARGNTLGLAIWARIHQQPDTDEVIRVFTTSAEATKAAYGFAGSNLDSRKEPLINNPFGPLRATNKYWLNLFGPGMTPPDWPGERRSLTYGGILIITVSETRS